MHGMAQFTLKRLLVSTAIIAAGCLPWALSSPVFPESAFLGAPLVGTGVGHLLKPCKLWITLAVVLGLVIAFVTMSGGLQRLETHILEHTFH
jgi:hypothetical protein